MSKESVFLALCFIVMGVAVHPYEGTFRSQQDLQQLVAKLVDMLEEQNRRLLGQEKVIQKQQQELDRQRQAFSQRLHHQDVAIQQMEQKHRQSYVMSHEKKSVKSSWGDIDISNKPNKRSDDIGAIEPVLSHMTQQMTEMTSDIQALKNADEQQIQARGTTYIRWGHDSCPDSSDLVYTGITSGGHHSSAGGGSNYLCLTSDPVFDGHSQPSGNDYSVIYGSEYRICPEVKCHTTPACAVCRVARASTVMIPGTNTCTLGWTLEYSGYIMSGFTSHASSEYICVDSGHGHYANSTQRENYENTVYYTHSMCGALSCPPYVNDRIVTCVVCTK